MNKIECKKNNIDITLKEFLSFLRNDSRVLLYDLDLAKEDWDDNDDFNVPIVYFGYFGDVPDIFLSRLVSCCMVSDEFVNCLCIELKRKKVIING